MLVRQPTNDAERSATLRCLFCEDPHPEHRAREAIALAEASAINLEGLVGAWVGEAVVAASLFLQLPDHSAFVWPVAVCRHAGAFPEEIGGELLREVVRIGAGKGWSYLQTAVDPSRNDQRQAFTAAGFRHLTDLQYLKCQLDPSTAASADRSPGVRYREPLRKRFEAVIERTYHQSHDCLGFTGVRSAADAMLAYQSAGDFAPEHWRLVEEQGEDVAVVLVNNHPEDCSREIVYLGVVPEARRRGIAQRLVKAILQQAVLDGIATMIVAVDRQNEPAANLYARFGFAPNFTRSIYLWDDGAR